MEGLLNTWCLMKQRLESWDDEVTARVRSDDVEGGDIA